MNLQEMMDLLNQAEGINEQAIILRDEGIEPFFNHPNEIVPYLDALGIYTDDINNFYIGEIFKSIDLIDYKQMNKAFEICLSAFLTEKTLVEIIDNLSRYSGIFVFDTDDILFSLTLNKLKGNKKYEIQAIKETYTIIFRKK